MRTANIFDPWNFERATLSRGRIFDTRNFQPSRFFAYQRLKWILALFAACLFIFWFTSPSTPKERIPDPPYAGPRDAATAEGDHGFLNFDEARPVCQRRRWEPYSTRDRRRKVYDLFLINTELDQLEIRLNELDLEVDYFVILESPWTFQMEEKPLFFKEKVSDYKQFEHKIIHQVLDYTGAKDIPKENTWDHEHYTRNALLDQVLTSLTGPQAPSQGDVILVGDVDEIPRPSVLRALRNCAFPPRVTLRTQMYYYSYQWLHRGELWHHPQATYWQGAQTVRPESLRMDEVDQELYMAGWHCSSCFRTMADMKNKITSFSHKEFSHPYFLDSQRLLDKVRRGEDLFERPKERYDRVDDNPDIPAYLQKEGNRQRFAYMLDRDPQNGNFEDL